MPLHTRLVAELLELDILRSNAGRQRVINDLPSGLAMGVEHANRADFHVQNIVARCLEIPNGMQWLLGSLFPYEGKVRRFGNVLILGILVQIQSIVEFGVGEDLIETTIREHLSVSAINVGEEDVWTLLFNAAISPLSAQPINALINNLVIALPIVRTELMILLNWLHHHPLLAHDSGYAIETAPASLPSCDLVLSVTYSSNHKVIFSLHSPNGKFPYHYCNLGSTQIEDVVNLRLTLQSTLERLGGFAHKPVFSLSKSEISTFAREIEDMGTELYESLLPQKFKEEYKVLRQHQRRLEEIERRATELIIVSDLPWIPWELLRPSIDGTDFWAGDFALIRLFPSSLPGNRLKIQNAHIVRSDLELEMVSVEQTNLETFAHGRFSLSKPIMNVDAFLSLCRTGGSQLIHVAAHGRHNETDLSLSELQLVDGSVALQNFNRRSAQGLFSAKPLVFLNTCHSGRLGMGIAGFDGWAKRFMLDFEVTAFIGSQWAIHDNLATVFSKEFYNALATNHPLGQAAHIARQKVRAVQPANPTWLAYTCYGNPDLNLEFSTLDNL